MNKYIFEHTKKANDSCTGRNNIITKSSISMELDQDLHGIMNGIVLSFSNLAKRAHLWQNREWIYSSSLVTDLTRKEQYCYL
jgi:hypothetical protein